MCNLDFMRSNHFTSSKFSNAFFFSMSFKHLNQDVPVHLNAALARARSLCERHVGHGNNGPVDGRNNSP